MNKFTPDTTYEGLLRQSRALHRIAELSLVIQDNYRKKDYQLSEPRLKALEESLESEREMNAILTEELEELRTKYEHLCNQLPPEHSG